MARLRRLAPLFALAVAMGLVWLMGWHKVLTLENIAAHRDALHHAVAEHCALALLAFVAIYIAVAGLSLPGGSIVTLTGGLLFGWRVGSVAALVGATAGATIVFLIARRALSAAVSHKAGPWIEKVRDGFQRNALSYLLFLRLVPAFPFWAVNLAPALLGVRLRTFVVGTFFGIIPGTLAIASVGAGLDAVLVSAETEHAACIAANGPDSCTFVIRAGALMNTQLVAALILLGVIALLPVFLFKRNDRAEM
jgi:uncharacterized membrane protein YdjX (TVP38/TMEM64 family)